MPSKKLFLIAGEASGDFHGAHLVRQLKQLDPNLICRGLGGQLMAAEGVELLYDLSKDYTLLSSFLHNRLQLSLDGAQLRSRILEFLRDNLPFQIGVERHGSQIPKLGRERCKLALCV